LVDVMEPVALVYEPGVELVIVTLNVQELAAEIEPPDKVIAPEPAVAVTVPPQEPVRLLGVATTIPVGRPSVNPTPVRATVFAEGFVAVKLTVEVPPGAIKLGAKVSASEGGPTTEMVADAVPPVPPSVELTVPVVLFFAPAVVPVTFREKVHELLAAIVPPERLTVPEPAAALTVPAPHVPVTPFGVETTKPAGSESVNATPEAAAVVLVFWIAKLRLVELFRIMFEAPKDLASTGGAITVTVASEVFPFPCVEVIETELLFVPAVVPVTFTVIVQFALLASVPAAKLTLVAPAVAVAIPPQLFVNDGVAATTMPAGRLSVNARPVRPRLEFGFVTMMVSEVEPLIGIFAAPNALATAGGAATARFAVAVLPVPPLVEVTAPVVFVYWPAVAPVTVTLN
jgi:hypothetical protein